MPGEDEPLHALITGPSPAEVKKGVKVVTEIVKEGIECPDACLLYTSPSPRDRG